jgi:hypothetical protein
MRPAQSQARTAEGRGQSAGRRRFDKPKWLTGSAAKQIARRLRSKGYPVIGMQSFFVQTTGGPLADGERGRAVAWGRELAAEVKATAAA